MRFTVVTWNIHRAIGGVDGRYRIERVNEVLSYYRPDAVLLQEVDEGARRSSYHRQVDLIAEALGMPYRIYGPTHHLRTKGRYGNAILSLWPLEDEHHLDLTITWRKKRGAIFARCLVGAARCPVSLLNLHLGLAGSVRRKQLQRLLASSELDRILPHEPLVLAGDFNDLYGTLGRRFLLPAGFQRCGRPVNTFPAIAPIRPLDGIFLRGAVEEVRSFASRMKLARYASDHLPLVAELSLAKRGS